MNAADTHSTLDHARYPDCNPNTIGRHGYTDGVSQRIYELSRVWQVSENFMLSGDVYKRVIINSEER